MLEMYRFIDSVLRSINTASMTAHISNLYFQDVLIKSKGDAKEN
jgi:hypothetical protein